MADEEEPAGGQDAPPATDFTGGGMLRLNLGAATESGGSDH